MQARLPGVPVGGPIPPTAVALLTATVLAGCGGGSSSATTASGASRASTTTTAARSASRSTTAKTAATGVPSAKEAAAVANDPSDRTAVTPSTPGGVKPEDRLGKTGFLAHAGLGLAAFHAYVSRALRKHDFDRPGAARKAAFAENAAAAAYAAEQLAAAASAAAHEARVARLASPLRGLSRRLSTIATGLKAGRLDTGAIVAARGEAKQIELTARNLGQPIQQVKPKLVREPNPAVNVEVK